MNLVDNLNKLSEELISSDQLCVSCKPKSTALSNILKDLYDSSVQLSSIKVGPFEQLFVEGLDLESIWEEIDTRNKPLTRLLNNKIAKLTGSVDDVIGNFLTETVPTEDNSEVSVERRGDSDESTNESNYEDESILNSDDGDEDVANDNGEACDEDMVDDEDMDAWLDKAERQEEQHYMKMQHKEKNAGHKGAAENQSEDDEEDDDMAFVQARMYEDEDDDAENGEAGVDCRYNDFFVGVIGRDVSERTAAGHPNRQKRVKNNNQDSEDELLNGNASDEEDEDEDGDKGLFGTDGDQDGEGDEDDEGFDEEGRDDYFDSEAEEDDERVLDPSSGKEVGNSKPLTKYQQKSAMMSSEIADLEAQLVQRRSWELRGEVKGADRPENSLLGISADIERSSKPAPLVTHEFTSSLEDAIRRRIKEDKFDDVAAPSNDDRRTARPESGPELSQERSRIGLGEVYAEHFLAKSLNSQPEAVSRKLEGAREEVLSLYHKVSMQLDELSHFFFAPRPVVADTKLQSLGALSSSGGLSSLELEDIVPLVNSSASQLAPEQVQQKRRGRDSSLLSAEELTSEDRKRLRRARKEAGRRGGKEGASDSEDGADTKAGRKRKLGKADRALDQELARDKRVTLSGGASTKNSGNDEDNTAYSKSAAFFTKLQHSAQAEISSGKGKESAGSSSKKGSRAGIINNGQSYKL